MQDISEVSSRIGPLNVAAMRATRARLDQLIPISTTAGVPTGHPRAPGPVDQAAKAVIVLAADHGVARAGVSAYPRAVTAEMVRNVLVGGAINVLARRAGARVVVADVGVAADLPAHPSLVSWATRPVAPRLSLLLTP